MKSPFPYFGSKSKIAGVVWDAFGAVRGYFEPFAGSLAVLLEADRNDNRYEVVNDADHYIVNFWRSLKNDPEETARWANNLNSEADLFARHLWLVNEGKNRLDRIEADPDYYDPKVAGWWVWGAANWIGSGWCFGGGPWKVIDGKVVKDSTGQGITRRLLDLDNRGINRKLLHLDNRGINRKRLNLGNTGQGINRKLLHLGGEGAGVDLGLQPITDYFNQLAERLRYVRICCGDFERIITIGAMCHRFPAGVFLDPPYSNELRSGGLYTHDDGSVTRRVYEWCKKYEDNPDYHIVLAGYDGEYDLPKWTKLKWHANRGMAGLGNENRHKETLWLSPACNTKQKEELF